MSKDFTKKIAAILAAATASVMILSVAYIAAEANHDCAGEDCPVCVCIEQCLNNLRTLGTAVEAKPETFIAEKFFNPPAPVYICLIAPITLINRKVRLDN